MQATVLMYILLGCAGSLIWLPVSSRELSTPARPEAPTGGQSPTRRRLVIAGAA
jgi:hypothetical protein